MCGVALIRLRHPVHERRRNPYVMAFSCPNASCSTDTLYACTKATLDAAVGGQAVRAEGLAQIAELAAADAAQLAEHVELDREKRPEWWQEFGHHIDRDLTYRKESDARRERRQKRSG